MSERSNIYFASDFHLGAPNRDSSLKRERRLVGFLDSCVDDASEIFLVGDLFDFWFEYAKVVPRGYVRLLGKMAEISDKGIPLHVFTGNHDMWIFDYLPSETGATLHRSPIVREWNGKRFMIGHGDGLGPGDHGYKFLKRVFSNPLSKWLFARLHPNFGISLAEYWSRKSRLHTGGSDAVFLGEENEWLVQYCRQVLEKEDVDYFIFGHRHLPMDITLSSCSRYINLGDWITHFTYARFDGATLELLHHKE